MASTNTGDARTATRTWLITDFDRINSKMIGSRREADVTAAELARRYPGNTVHVLETVAAFHSDGIGQDAREIPVVG